MSQLRVCARLLRTELLCLLHHEGEGDREVLRLQIQQVKLLRSVRGQTFFPVPRMYFCTWLKKRGWEGVQREISAFVAIYEQGSNGYLQRICVNVLFPT